MVTVFLHKGFLMFYFRSAMYDVISIRLGIVGVCDFFASMWHMTIRVLRWSDVGKLRTRGRIIKYPKVGFTRADKRTLFVEFENFTHFISENVKHSSKLMNNSETWVAKTANWLVRRHKSRCGLREKIVYERKVSLYSGSVKDGAKKKNQNRLSEKIQTSVPRSMLYRRCEY